MTALLECLMGIEISYHTLVQQSCEFHCSSILILFLIEDDLTALAFCQMVSKQQKDAC